MVHSDRPKHAYLNPIPDPRISPRRGFASGDDGVQNCAPGSTHVPYTCVHPSIRVYGVLTHDQFCLPKMTLLYIQTLPLLPEEGSSTTVMVNHDILYQLVVIGYDTGTLNTVKEYLKIIVYSSVS